MVTKLATDYGLAAESLYFNIARVGNLSAASIPVAIHDAVQERVIDRPMRIFTPGFGAGASADTPSSASIPLSPCTSAPSTPTRSSASPMPNATSSDDVRDAFGG
ncbi:MAG: 3-oxoacyl-[acyl-carrier-protein] synthase III C-terminal domain-containing protein [Candidatus Limnocylindria bacterium]